MTEKEYKIVELEELLSARATADQDPEPVYDAIIENPDPDMSESKEAPDKEPGRLLRLPGEPELPRKVQPRPERLKHMSPGEIQMLQLDGGLTPEEASWLQSRQNIHNRWSWPRAKQWMF